MCWPPAQLAWVELHRLGLVGLGHHGHRRRAGVDTALGLGGGHALYAVAAGLEAQPPVGAGARDAQHHFLVAAKLAGRLAHRLHLPALFLGVARVKTGEVAGEQGRLVATGAGPDFDKSIALVVRVFRQQELLQLGVQLRQVGLGRVDFLLCHLGHVGIVEHLPRRRQVGLALQIAVEHLDHRGGLGMFAAQRAKAIHLIDDIGRGQQRIEFVQSGSLAQQGVTDEGFHVGSVGQARRHGRRPATPCTGRVS